MKLQQGCLLGVRSSRGFTLIEVMIVAAIIAILAAIALPNYRQHVLRSNRAAAAGYLLEVANAEERYLLDKRRYAASMGTLGMTAPADVSNNYTVAVSDPGGTGLAYTITATPKGSQTADTECGTLSLTHQGTKSATGSGTRCWN